MRHVDRPASVGQIRAVQAIKATVFRGDDPIFRDALRMFERLELRERESGKLISSTWLNNGEADTFIRQFGTTKQKGTPYYGGGTQGEASGHLTQDQAELIGRLEADLGWTGYTTRKWILKLCKKNCHPSMLLKHEAKKLITTMEALKKQNSEAKHERRINEKY
jgi:hypothetical protein